MSDLSDESTLFDLRDAVFRGLVPSDTVISNSVLSASYTPGAGKVW